MKSVTLPGGETVPALGQGTWYMGERRAEAAKEAAALRLGATFDPNFLGRVGIRGNPGDPAQAASWYRRARDLGDAAAAERLKRLEGQPR